MTGIIDEAAGERIIGVKAIRDPDGLGETVLQRAITGFSYIIGTWDADSGQYVITDTEFMADRKEYLSVASTASLMWNEASKEKCFPEVTSISW